MQSYLLNWDAMIDIKAAIQQALQKLKPTSPSPRIDAEVLLAHVLGVTRSYIYTYPEKSLNKKQIDDYHHLILKRSSGSPIAYLIGSREFWSLPFRVNQNTLIPRPETELLVELTLSLLRHRSPASLLDLGTGSGAVAIAIANERPDWQLLATDISETAIDVAQQNAKHLQCQNVHFFQSDWFSSMPPQTFDAIVSNPPYIASDDPHLQQGDLPFEPQQALVSGIKGLDALTLIIQQSYDWLLPGGLLLVEHGFQQKMDVTSLLRNSGYDRIHCWQDAQGIDRISGGWRKS